MLEKLKSLLRNDQLFYGLLLLLVSFCSFGLGRASVPPEQSQPAAVRFSEGRTIVPESPLETSIMKAGATATLTQPTNTTGGDDQTVVASKTGKKYHLPACPGAKQIKPENLVSFTSREAALAAGYTPATNCPGLK